MEHSDKLLLRSSSSEDTTPEMGIRIGQALAVDYKTVVVGMDLVKSSPMLKAALISGLISAGANVIDLDIVSEPVAAYAARMGDCCVYVTEFRQFDLVSGYLLINRDGSFFGKDQIRRLELVDQQGVELPDYKSIGNIKPYYNATRHYNDDLYARSKDIPGGSMVLNCNCGAATDSAPQVLNAIGTDIISINAQKDRNFLTSSLSVKEADIRHMKALVEANPGSIGISMNRIGTLMRVFDENGDPLTDEQSAAVEVVTADGATWIADVVEERGPNAERVMDPFHVVSWATSALDELRKQAWRDARKDKTPEGRALAKGVKVTGATVHFVNEIPDGGQIIAQKAVRVREGDTPEKLQKRVMQQAEWKLLPVAVEQICAQIIEAR